MAPRIPERVRVAVDVLDPAPDARVLEIGCGPGVAAGLLCDRVPSGHVTGLDRSATAIERAERRLRRYLDEGRADLQHRDLVDFHGDGRPYDVVFAVNVDVFWAHPADVEVARLADLVAVDGAVRLFYELPAGVGPHAAATGARAALERGGFAVRTRLVDGILCVEGRRPG